MQIIVLEDTKEYISYAPKEEILAQERRHFDLMVKRIELECLRVVTFETRTKNVDFCGGFG